jgi:CRISPR-associated endonuclease/helicase Cas3
MSNSYQLKSHPDRLLYHHLKSVGSMTKSIVEDIFPKITTDISLADLAEATFVIGATHDIGKGTIFFQDYLLGRMKLDPLLKSHSMISSLYCSWCILDNSKISDDHRDLLAVASALAIQGHHGSLKRPTSYLIHGLDVFDDKKIFTRQFEAFQNINELEKISENLRLRSFVEFTKNWDRHFYEFSNVLRKSSSYIQKKFLDLREPYFIINLLYSILLDADRTDAAGLKLDRIEIRPDMVTEFVRKLNSQLSYDNTINRVRNTLFDSIYKESMTIDLDNKLFTLTAPTGLGKTLTSVNFALTLRERIRKRSGFIPRIIYVAPFISILDQNMKVLQDVFQSQRLRQSNLLLMHHHLAPINYTKNMTDEQRKESYSTSQSELLIQGWNSEIIVTTFVQFFNTIFGRFTSQLRRLHNLLGSIIILDETQSIPFEYWNAVRNALLFLSEKFGFIIIMMTATQPLIFAKNETKELVPIDILRNLPQRVKFHTRNQRPIKIDEFCMEVNNLINENKTKSILIELNTISNANSVFRSIKEMNTTTDNLFFLSSQIIPKHRRPRIDQIKDQRGPVVLVSTQVIEAGVDLDFDIAIRDIGPIDSIVQTSGRCNRNGKRKATDSPFFIYRIVDDNNHDIAKRIYGRVSIDISNSLLCTNSNILELVKSYYEEVRRRRSSQPSDEIKAAMSELNYEKVEQSFKLIDQDFKFPVFVEFDEDAIKIWNRFVETRQPEARKLSRNEIIQQRHEMEQYMIGVSELDIERLNLQETFSVYKINHENIGILYDEITGFGTPRIKK